MSNDDTGNPSEFEKLSQQPATTFIGEFLIFMREHKAWWMVPIFLVLGLVGLLVLLTSTGVAPFIYTLF